MKNIFALLIIIPVLSGCVTSRQDIAKLRGNWRPVEAVLGGNPLPAAVLQTISLRIDDGQWLVQVGNQPDRGTFKLDTAARPKEMLITGTEGPNKGRVFPSIYETHGDTLRICYDLSGQKRPEEFKSIAGTKLYLVTYQRVR